MINGSSSDTAAAIIDNSKIGAGYGVELTGGVCLNFGTIAAGPGAYAVKLTGGHLTNGDASDRTALIKGKGIVLGSNATITNFGTIVGSNGHAVVAKYASDAVIVEAGSAFQGEVVCCGGLLDLASGTGTIRGLAKGLAIVSGSMPTAVFGDFGTLEISAAASFTVVGGVGVAVGEKMIDAGSLALGGSINNSGTIELIGAAGVLKLTANTNLTGGGTLVVGSTGTDKIYGASTGTLLINTDNVILGGGQIGAGSLALSNGAKGVIVGDVAAALVIDTGANTITNAGLIEATGIGSVTIRSTINNVGRLESLGGRMTVAGPVSGAGIAVIDGGSITFSGAFTEKVSFLGAGVLGLARSQGYSGSIFGFSRSGATSLDLLDVGFVSSGEATFAGGPSGGVLTVTDGTHTARINLRGDYTTSTFVCFRDSHGGVLIVDPGTPAPTVSPLKLISAMAGMGATPGATVHASDAGTIREPILIGPRVAIA